MLELEFNRLKGNPANMGEYPVKDRILFVDTVPTSRLIKTGEGNFCVVYTIPGTNTLVKRVKTLLRAHGYDRGFKYTLDDFKIEVAEPIHMVQNPANWPILN